MKTIRLLRDFSLFVVLLMSLFFMAGCFGNLDSGTQQPVTPNTPYSTDSDLFKIDPNMEYNDDVANGTAHIESKLSNYDLLPIAKKFEYDALQKKKEKNRDLINQARMERMGADMAIINVLQGGINVEQGNNESYRQVNSDPETEIKHQEWIKEKCDIEIEGLETENNKLNTQMDKILEEATKSCFPKDTLVLRKDGSLTPIQNIQIGDDVMVYDIGNDKISFSKVNQKYIDKNNHMYVINDSIHATAYERFLTLDGWKKIREIEPQIDSIFDGNSFVKVESKYKLNKNLTVYNLNIDSAHNFFVSPQSGSSLYLIHNTGGGGGSGGGGSDGGGK